MSVPPVAPSSFTSSAPAARPEFNKKIVIDWTEITEYAGLKPDSVVQCTWCKSKDLPPIDIDVLIAEGVQLCERKFEGKSPFSLTFKTAVRLVLEWILNSDTDEEGCKVLHYGSECLHDAVIIALSSADTPDYASLSAVPKGKFGKAEENHVQRLLGAIIHLLKDQRLIADYGRINGCYYVQLKQVQEEGKRS